MVSDLRSYVSFRTVSSYSKKFFRLFRITNRLRRVFTVLMVGALLSNSAAAATVETAPIATSFAQDLRYAFYSSGWAKWFGINLTSATLQASKGGDGKGAPKHDRPAPAKAEKREDREARVARVKIYPGDVKIHTGATVVFNAFAEDNEGNSIGGQEVKWTALNEESHNNISVSSKGEFKSSVPGKYILTAEIAGIREQVKVNVFGEKVRLGKSLELNAAPNATIQIDSKERRRKRQLSRVVPLSGIAKHMVARNRGRELKAATTGLVRSSRNFYLPQLDIGEDPTGINSSTVDKINDVGHERGNMPGRAYSAGTGSGNFQLTAPAVSLDGRGIDVNLAFNYNSRVWHKDSNVMYFDIDRDWYSGWNLGFGKIVMAGDQYMLIDNDGTRHEYSGVTKKWFGNDQTYSGHTTDGTFIDYAVFGLQKDKDSNNGKNIHIGEAALPNGTKILYGAPGNYAIYPTIITDAHGNYITITYRNNVTNQEDTGPYISSIKDTLGREIKFHYATGTNLLTAITVPGLKTETNPNPSDRQVVRINYRDLNLKTAGPTYGFTLPTSVRQDVVPVINAIYYPGTNTGYWFGDDDSYSRYGMIRKVSEQRGMTFNNAFLNDPGIIGAGAMSRELVYSKVNQPTPGYSNLIGTLDDTPLYDQMTEDWVNRQSDIPITTVTSIDENSKHKYIVTRPDGVRSIQYSNTDTGSSHYGLMTESATYPAIDDNSTADDIPFSRLVTYFEDGAYGSSRPGRIESYDERGRMTYVTMSYESNFNAPTDIREYGWGGQMLKRVHTEYLNSNTYVGKVSDINTYLPPVWLGSHIFNLPMVVEIFAGNDTTRLSRVEYVYDDNDTPLINIPDVLQHDPSYNPYILPEVRCSDEPDPDDPDCDQSGDPCWMSCESLPCGRCDRVCDQINVCREYVIYNEDTKFRGNVTKTTTYADGGNLDPTTAIVANYTYDITGNVRIQSTACCEQASFNYTSATGYAWPESMTHGSIGDPGSQNTTRAVYEFNTGLMMGAYDANGRYSSTVYDAASLRPTFEYSPTGAYVHYVYSDSLLGVSERVYEAGKNGGDFASGADVYFDGKGRVRHSYTFVWDVNKLVTDEVRVHYDNLGRVSEQSLPWRTGSAGPFLYTTTEYDDLDRPIKIKSPDGSVVERVYNSDTKPSAALSNEGQRVLSRDAWGRERWGRFDEQNRLVEVVEPNPLGDGTVANNGMSTQYQYDTLGNLIQVNHGDQVRKFKYDSLGRLTHQKLAERDATLDDVGNWISNGTWSDIFRYDNRSNLTLKKDARGVLTLFEYYDDPLNRLKVVWYKRDQVPSHLAGNISDSPNISYGYAASGDKMRVTNVSVDGGLGNQEIFYDGESRVSEVRQSSRGGIQLYTNYLWDTLSRIKEVRYPQQVGAGDARKIVAHNYEIGSRLKDLSYDSKTMASAPVFNAASQITSLAIGDKLSEKYDFDPLTGLLTGQQVNKGSEKLLNLKYNYTRNNDANNNGAKTGQLTSITDLKNTARNRAYVYDPLGRLYQVKGGANASTTTPDWNQIYNYDRYGNKTGQTKTGGDPVQSNPVETTWFDDALPAGAVVNAVDTQAVVSVGLKNKEGFYITAVSGGGWEVNLNPSGTKGAKESFRLVDLNGGTLESGDSIRLLAQNGTHYLSAHGGGGGSCDPPIGQVFANTIQPGAWETFVVSKADGSTGTIGTGGQVSLKSSGGYYFWSEQWSGSSPPPDSPLGNLYANRTTIVDWEKFALQVSAVNADNAPIKVGFRSSGNFYISAVKGSGWEVNVNQTTMSTNQTFDVVDLNGGQLESGDQVRFKKDDGACGSGYYLSIYGGGAAQGTPLPNGRAYMKYGTPSNNETFTIVKSDGSSGVIGQGTSISMKTENGYYFCAEGGGHASSITPPLGRLYASRNSSYVTVGERETFTIDLTTTGGGGYDESWNWITSNPPPQSRTKAHQTSIATGFRQHFFTGATDTLSVGSGDSLYTWVYLDPANMPSEIMLQWNDGSGWEHRAYWGANNWALGTDGTASRKHMGDLPPAGQWVKLVIPASAVGLEGKSVSGMAFGLYGGRATWDKSGKITPGAVASLGIPLDGLANQNVNPISYNSTNNRITSPGYEYDSAGNLTAGSVDAQQIRRTFKYDTANRLRQVFDVNGTLIADYLYGASNERIAFTENGVTTWYAREGGQVIAEYEAIGATGLQWKMSYVYMGGRLLATEQSNGIRYHHPDRLGSRLVTDSSDGSVISENIHLPFGTAMPNGPTLGGDNSWQNPNKTNLSKKKFTSYDRSDATGLDYAINRHYSSAQGRFTQVDPIGMASVNPMNPQTLNLYAYCANDPINFVDPTGEILILPILIGFAIGAATSYLMQKYQNPSQPVSWGKVVIAGVFGAIGGGWGASASINIGRLGLTAWNEMWLNTGAQMGIGAFTNVLQSVVTDGFIDGRMTSTTNILYSAGAGAFGGAVGGGFIYNAYAGAALQSRIWYEVAITTTVRGTVSGLIGNSNIPARLLETTSAAPGMGDSLTPPAGYGSDINLPMLPGLSPGALSGLLAGGFGCGGLGPGSGSYPKSLTGGGRGGGGKGGGVGGGSGGGRQCWEFDGGYACTVGEAEEVDQ